jgi:HEAT repeat protein
MKILPLNPIATLALLLACAPLSSAGDEAAQLGVLKKPDATLAQRQDACRKLALVGTAEAVPVLAALLGDAELSHMARHALEPIPDPSVDAALRGALATVKGRQLLGVIGSIGVRGDAQAIPALAKLLANSDPAVAETAARALGEIGTAAAAKPLQSNLKGASPAQLNALCEGLFRCAESLEGQEARDIYDLLRGLPEAPHQIRGGALRGAILARDKAGLPMLTDALGGDEWTQFHTATRISMEMQGAEVTAALAGALGKLSPERQVLIVQTLGLRGDASAAPALMPLLEAPDIPVRVATLNALTRLAHVPVVPALAKLLAATDAEVAKAAKECLASFPGEAADEAITRLVKSTDADARSLGIELVAGRSAEVAIPTLLQVAAADQDEAVRVTSLNALRELAGTRELEPLLKILLESDSETVIQSVSHALVVVCVRQKPSKEEAPPAACVDPLIAALDKASGPSRKALIQVLRRVGGPKAEAAVRRAAGGGEN